MALFKNLRGESRNDRTKAEALNDEGMKTANETEARQRWTAAAEADSSWPVPYFNLGMSYCGEGDFKRADNYFKKAESLTLKSSRSQDAKLLDHVRATRKLTALYKENRPHPLVLRYLEELGSTSVATRQSALTSLGYHDDFTRIPGVLERLVRVLRWDQSHAVREAAAEALGRTKDRSVLPSLFEALGRETMDNVKRKIINALGTTGDERALPVLTRALEKSTNAETACEIVSAIRHAGGLTAIPLLLRVASQDGPDITKKRAIWELRTLKDPQADEALVTLCHDEQQLPEVRTKALEGLRTADVHLLRRLCRDDQQPLPLRLAAIERLPVRAMTRPPDLEEIDAEVDRLNKQKEEAIANQEFDKAASLRDQADKLKKEAGKLKKREDSITDNEYERVFSDMCLDDGQPLSLRTAALDKLPEDKQFERALRELSRDDQPPTLRVKALLKLRDATGDDAVLLSVCREPSQPINLRVTLMLALKKTRDANAIPVLLDLLPRAGSRAGELADMLATFSEPSTVPALTQHVLTSRELSCDVRNVLGRFGSAESLHAILSTTGWGTSSYEARVSFEAVQQILHRCASHVDTETLRTITQLEFVFRECHETTVSKVWDDWPDAVEPHEVWTTRKVSCPDELRKLVNEEIARRESRKPLVSRSFVSVVCRCGKRLRCPSEHAGKKGRCKTCGAVIMIPPPDLC